MIGILMAAVISAELMYGSWNVLIGFGAGEDFTWQSYDIAIGVGASAHGNCSIALGDGAVAEGNNVLVVNRKVTSVYEITPKLKRRILAEIDRVAEDDPVIGAGVAAGATLTDQYIQEWNKACGFKPTS